MKKLTLLAMLFLFLNTSFSQQSLDSLRLVLPRAMGKMLSCDITSDRSKFLFTDGALICNYDFKAGRIIDNVYTDIKFDVIWSLAKGGIGALTLSLETKEVIIYSIFNHEIIEKIRFEVKEIISRNDIDKSLIIRDRKNVTYLIDLRHLEKFKINYKFDINHSHNYYNDILIIRSSDRVSFFSKEMSKLKFERSSSIASNNNIFYFSPEISNFFLSKDSELEIYQWPSNKTINHHFYTEPILFAEMNRESGELIVNSGNNIYLYSYPKYELLEILELPKTNVEFNFIGYYGSGGNFFASTKDSVFFYSAYNNEWTNSISIWNENEDLELSYFQEYTSLNKNEILFFERNSEIFYSPLIYNLLSKKNITIRSRSIIPEEYEFSNIDDRTQLLISDNSKMEKQVYLLPNFNQLKSEDFIKKQYNDYYIDGEHDLFGFRNLLFHSEHISNPRIYSRKDSNIVKALQGDFFTCLSSNQIVSAEIMLCTINSSGKLDLFNIARDTLVYSLRGASNIIKSCFSDNGMELFLLRENGVLEVLNYSIRIMNKISDEINSKQVISLQKVPNYNLLSIVYPDEVHFLGSVHGDILWKINFFEQGDFLIRLADSPYYMCSKDASKMLHYVTPSLKVIGFEQLDPVYNRPDIVLDSIGKYFGGADQELVANYRKSWEKRIDRLGLDKEKLGKGEIAVPNAEIVGADAIAYENKNGKLDIKVAANDPKYPLRRFNVYVNEVPLYGSAGISIAHLKKQIWDTTVSVPLSIGENKIQVSVMNEIGLENFKYPCYVNYTPLQAIVAKTYYIGIGVNEFKESSHNLKYCVKDVTDLSMSFGGPNTEVKLFTNEQVTKENILALKDYLSKTTVNDKVIISCSSHGLLDDSLNFYLAMHDVDFNNPKERGLKYEALENLLDGIPARQKLLLLDACNSGENDKTELIKRELEQKNSKMDSTQILAARGVKIKLEDENKSNFKKMNELFVNVRNNTGSVIISAAGGQESALEAITVDGKSIENGAFSYCVLEYLKNNSNKPEELTVNKLKNYVEKRVEEITNGKQQPTSRQETMEIDWELR